MRRKALVVEPSRLFQGILKKIMDTSGVECHVFSTAEEALENAESEYTFIFVSRELNDVSGAVFIGRYSEAFKVGEAITVLLHGGELADGNKGADIEADFKMEFNRQDVDEIQEFVVGVINKLTLDLAVNVLLVEDSQAIADMESALLQENGSKVTHVACIEDMKYEFSNYPVDLVISDYHLKDGETGDDVIAFVRNYPCGIKSETPILVVSGEASQEKRTSFLRNGANDFIIKPFDGGELMVRSSNLVRSSRLLKQVRSQKEMLMTLALTDQLTGLYNRHSLYDLSPKYVSSAKRHNTPLSLLVIDLDHFKSINDTKGHTAGDRVLTLVATVLKELCREEDMVARYGGEEFVMLLASCDRQNACHIAERVRMAIYNLEYDDLDISASIGVAQLLETDKNFEDIFERADKAVYNAKAAGRNRVFANCHSGATH